MMNTTSLFVEIIVIGIGAIWALFMLLASVDIQILYWSNSIVIKENMIIVSTTFLSLTYLLGIIVDRLADQIFNPLAQKIKGKVYKDSNNNILNDKISIYQQATPLVEMINYARSRMRICRGWLINVLLIIPSLNLYLLKYTALPITMLLLTNSIIIIFWGALFLSWKNLTLKEYQKIQSISRLLVD